MSEGILSFDYHTGGGSTTGPCYDGVYSSKMDVEYSIDSGNTWVLLDQIQEWINLNPTNKAYTITLSGGYSSIKFRFTSNTTTVWESWHIDNIRLVSSSTNQDLSLMGNTLSLTQDPTSIDLSPYLDNTDNQGLIISGNSLSISNSSSAIDLSPYLDNTDNQNLSLNNDSLFITNGTQGIDLSILSYWERDVSNQNIHPKNLNDSIGIGTANPNNLLDIAGTAETQGFKMTNGASNGYILQSDASGLASWVDPSTIIGMDDGDWVQLDVNSDGSPDQLWKNSMPVGIGWQFSSGNLDKLKFAVSGDGDFDGDHVVAIRNNGNDTESGSGEDVLFLQIMNTDSDGNSSNGVDGLVGGRNNFITFAGPYNASSGDYWRYGRIEGVAPNPNLAAMLTNADCLVADLNFSATDPATNAIVQGCYLTNGGVVYASGNGDYAEWLEKANIDEEINKTDVVGVKGGKITKNTEDAEQV